MNNDKITQQVEMVKKYDRLFHGVGKMKDTEINIHVDTTVTPIAQKARRLPIMLQQQVDLEIEKLIADKIVEPAPHPQSR